MTKAFKAIERSVSHNEIVTVDADSEGNIIAELLPMCDDHVETIDRAGIERHEFWGTDDDGNEWRVHVRLNDEDEDEEDEDEDVAYGYTFEEWLRASGRNDSASMYDLRAAWREGEDPEAYFFPVDS